MKANCSDVKPTVRAHCITWFKTKERDLWQPRVATHKVHHRLCKHEARGEKLVENYRL
jgi:hypothetical protein